MIKVTRLDGKVMYINPQLIESIESTPDTVITFTSGKKHLVQEDAETIVEQIYTYRRNINFRVLES